MAKRVFKDREPEVTVAAIRAILHEIGIHPYEQIWLSASDQVCSVRLQDEVLGVGVNGKGVSRAYALASAYGEFMERIQNQALIGRDYGLMTEDGCLYPDARRIPLSELLQRLPHVMDQLISGPVPPAVLEEYDQRGAVCAPFYSVTDNRVDDLPIEFIEMACQTNGLCAGNTPAEALCQGLSEIAERWIAMRVFRDAHLAIPVVPPVRYADLGVNALIASIAAAGMRVVVKDCTFEGRWPVLAVIVLNTEGTEYIVSLGAAPDFETALERCITEAFQGIGHFSSKSKPLDVCYENHLQPCYPTDAARKQHMMYRALMSTDGHYPDGFFLDRGTSGIDRAFVREFDTFQNALRFLVEGFHQDGRTVYLRDVSFLGFPAFRVYVPGISEFVRLGCDRPWLSPSEQQLMRRCANRLQDCSNSDLVRMVALVEKMEEYPLFYRQQWRKCLDPRLLLAPASPSNAMFQGPGGTQTFLALAHLHLGNINRAHHHWQSRIARQPETVIPFDACCGACLRLMADGVALDACRFQLTGLFDPGLVDCVIAALGHPDGFLGLRLPRCGDCQACPVLGECRYPEWRVVSERVQTRAAKNVRDQRSLRDLFDATAT